MFRLSLHTNVTEDLDKVYYIKSNNLKHIQFSTTTFFNKELLKHIKENFLALLTDYKSEKPGRERELATEFDCFKEYIHKKCNDLINNKEENKEKIITFFEDIEYYFEKKKKNKKEIPLIIEVCQKLVKEVDIAYNKRLIIEEIKSFSETNGNDIKKELTEVLKLCNAYKARPASEEKKTPSEIKTNHNNIEKQNNLSTLKSQQGVQERDKKVTNLLKKDEKLFNDIMSYEIDYNYEINQILENINNNKLTKDNFNTSYNIHRNLNKYKLNNNSKNIFNKEIVPYITNNLFTLLKRFNITNTKNYAIAFNSVDKYLELLSDEKPITKTLIDDIMNGIKFVFQNKNIYQSKLLIIINICEKLLIQLDDKDLKHYLMGQIEQFKKYLKNNDDNFYISFSHKINTIIKLQNIVVIVSREFFLNEVNLNDKQFSLTIKRNDLISDVLLTISEMMIISGIDETNFIVRVGNQLLNEETNPRVNFYDHLEEANKNQEKIIINIDKEKKSSLNYDSKSNIIDIKNKNQFNLNHKINVDDSAHPQENEKLILNDNQLSNKDTKQNDVDKNKTFIHIIIESEDIKNKTLLIEVPKNITVLEFKIKIIPYFEDNIDLFDLYQSDNKLLSLDSSQDKKVINDVLNCSIENKKLTLKQRKNVKYPALNYYAWTNSSYSTLKPQVKKIINQIFNGNYQINFRDITKICPLLNKQGEISQLDFQKECLKNVNWLNYLISFSDNLTTSLRIFPEIEQDPISNNKGNLQNNKQKKIVNNNNLINSELKELNVQIYGSGVLKSQNEYKIHVQFPENITLYGFLCQIIPHIKVNIDLLDVICNTSFLDKNSSNYSKPFLSCFKDMMFIDSNIISYFLLKKKENIDLNEDLYFQNNQRSFVIKAIINYFFKENSITTWKDLTKYYPLLQDIKLDKVITVDSFYNECRNTKEILDFLIGFNSDFSPFLRVDPSINQQKVSELILNKQSQLNNNSQNISNQISHIIVKIRNGTYTKEDLLFIYNTKKQNCRNIHPNEEYFEKQVVPYVKNNLLKMLQVLGREEYQLQEKEFYILFECFEKYIDLKFDKIKDKINDRKLITNDISNLIDDIYEYIQQHKNNLNYEFIKDIWTKLINIPVDKDNILTIKSKFLNLILNTQDNKLKHSLEQLSQYIHEDTSYQNSQNNMNTVNNPVKVKSNNENLRQNNQLENYKESIIINTEEQTSNTQQTENQQAQNKIASLKTEEKDNFIIQIKNKELIEHQSIVKEFSINVTIFEFKCEIIPFFKDNIDLYSLTSQYGDNIKIDSSQNNKILYQLMKNPKKQNILSLTKTTTLETARFYYTYSPYLNKKVLGDEIDKIISNQIYKGNQIMTWSNISEMCPLIQETGTISINDFKILCLKDLKYLNYLIAISFSYELSLRIFPSKKKQKIQDVNSITENQMHSFENSLNNIQTNNSNQINLRENQFNINQELNKFNLQTNKYINVKIQINNNQEIFNQKVQVNLTINQLLSKIKPNIHNDIDFVKFENKTIDKKNYSKQLVMFLNNSHTQNELRLSLFLREPYLQVLNNVSSQPVKIINTNVDRKKQTKIITHNSINQANNPNGEKPKSIQRSRSQQQNKLNQKSQRICDYFKCSQNIILYKLIAVLLDLFPLPVNKRNKLTDLLLSLSNDVEKVTESNNYNKISNQKGQYKSDIFSKDDFGTIMGDFSYCQNFRYYSLLSVYLINKNINYLIIHSENYDTNKTTVSSVSLIVQNEIQSMFDIELISIIIEMQIQRKNVYELWIKCDEQWCDPQSKKIFINDEEKILKGYVQSINVYFIFNCKSKQKKIETRRLIQNNEYLNYPSNPGQFVRKNYQQRSHSFQPSSKIPKANNRQTDNFGQNVYRHEFYFSQFGHPQNEQINNIYPLNNNKINKKEQLGQSMYVPNRFNKY